MEIKEIVKSSPFYSLLRSFKNGFVYLFSPFGYIRNYILFPIAGTLRKIKFKPFYNQYKFIDEMRGLHKGKRCFIIATGPSLKVEDVECLSNEITIALNSFYRIYDKTEFRPTYYACLDPDVQKNLIDNYNGELKSLAKNMVFMNSIVNERKAGVNYLPYCYQNHWFKVFAPNFDYSKNLRYTEDLLFGCYDKYTITTAAIDIAIHLGCKEIYLIGVDCNYSGQKNYFIDPGKNAFKPDEIQAFLVQKAMMAGYKFLEEETKKRGIKIYNATRGGMLEEFERVCFENITLNR